MKIDTLVWTNKRLFRKVFGPNSRAEKLVKTYLGSLLSRVNQRYRIGETVVFWSGRNRARRVGIYAVGGCDVNAIYACEEFIRPHLDGTCCIVKQKKHASAALSNVLLQTGEELPREAVAEIVEKLHVEPGYFKSQLFDPTVVASSPEGTTEFPKDVVLLSTLPDVVRTVYRHKASGLIVDPGGWWLNQMMSNVLQDLDALKWFQKEFEKIGRLSLQDSMENLREIILRIRQNSDPLILAFNGLTVDPAEHAYNYQFVFDPEVIRRRQYNAALKDLSRELDFSIVDIDRVLKYEGVAGQVDFAHWTATKFEPIAKEIVRILVEGGIFAKR